MRLKKSESPVKLGCLGKVKTGMKHEKGYPISLDYFRFDSKILARMDKVKEICGDKPNSIEITFYSNDMNEVCTQRLELRDKAGRLVAYGDGEVFMISKESGWVERKVVSEEDKAYIKMLQTQYTTDKYKAAFRETLILRFLIVGFPEIGYWELRTYGKETAIPQITSVFDWCLQNFGRVMFVPFTLTVGKHKSNRAEVNRNYSIIELFCNVGVNAIEAVRDWNGVGLMSGDKLAQKSLGSGEMKAEDLKNEDVVDFAEVVDIEEDNESEENKWLKMVKDNLWELCHDLNDVERYYKELCKEYGENNLRSIDGFIEVFQEKGKVFEVDN